MKLIQQIFTYFVRQERDPRYVFVLLGASVILVLTCLQVLSKGLFDSVEQPIFAFINTLPNALYGVMYAITQFGGLGSLLFWVGAAWYLINRRAALSVIATGFIAWTLAKIVKISIGRGRPGDVLDGVQLFGGETLGGFGFPSGHAAFSAACATILYYQVPARYRKYLLIIVFLAGISRMYLGAHFPLDIVGGWALGAVVGSLIALIFGMSRKGLSVRTLKKFLSRKGYPTSSIAFAAVDARGSKPLFMTTEDGQHYFGKIFGKKEHAADWLFKIFRFFRYKNLQAEEPYVNSRRNIEMESFAMLWAKQAGVRVPKVIDLLRFGSSWVLLQQRLDAKPLASHGHLMQKSLVDAWKQVEKLHQANIAHRDLRAANLMIDKKGQAWIIDFGFAEVSSQKQRQYMDVAELLMSMSLVAGVNRTLDAAVKTVPHDKLIRALPYLQKAVFSGATAKQLKKQKHLLDDLRTSLQQRLKHTDDIVDANILRMSPSKILNVALIAVFIYVIAPQFGSFKDAFTSIDISHPLWLVVLAVASALTYVLTGIIYVALADVPLKIRESSLVQLAASFISKVLPGGLANTGMNAKYLTKAGLDGTETSSVLVTQGAVGFIMFAVPLGMFLVLNGESIGSLINFDIRLRYVVMALVALTIFAAAAATFHKLRMIVVSKIVQFIESLRSIATPSRELGFASLASLGVTLSYILCLYAAFRAFDIPLGISAAVLVYASAVIAKSAIPTPGGLGPLEVAMVATMVGLGVGKADAFSVVILYRLATFWLPVPFSLLAYKYIRRKKLI